MNGLLIINLVFKKIQFKLKYVRLFIFNLRYFLCNLRQLSPGTYVINSRVIIQKQYVDHEHFRQTILNWKPRITLYNVWGSKDSQENMIGFHPDLKYTIDFDNRIVTKSFYRDMKLVSYSQKRNIMSNHVSAPDYQIIDTNQYREELIMGKPFCISSKNVEKFDKLLSEFNDLLSSSNYSRVISMEPTKELAQIAQVIMSHININKSLFFALICTNHISLSKGSDIAGPNIIEAEDRLVLIDWEPNALKYRRFWVDIINLMIKCDPIGFLNGEYDGQLVELFYNHDIGTNLPITIEDKVAIFCASALVNIKSIDQIDLLEDLDQLACGGITSIKTLEIQQVARSAKGFFKKYI